jgi:hypothetical protein
MRTSLLFFALFFAFGLSALAETQIKLDCTIRYWTDADRKGMEHDYQTGYSATKVAPKDIAWLHPGTNPVGHRTSNFVVLGSCKKANLSNSTDVRNLMAQLSNLASDHGANAISYEKYGMEIHFEFLRIKDTIIDAVRRRKKIIAHGE